MNSFEMIASFRKQAREAGWTKERIEEVTKDAVSKDREHLEEVLFEALSELKI